MADEHSLFLQLVQLSEDETALTSFRGQLPGRPLGIGELRAVRRAVRLVAESLHEGEGGRALLEAASDLLRSAASGTTTSEGATHASDSSPESSTMPTSRSIEAETEKALRSPSSMARHTLTVDGRTMTLPEYAALCAACGAFPDRVRETHAKFSVPDQAARQRLDEAWQQCFADDAQLAELWRVLRAQFRAWLVQYGQL